MFIFPSGIPSGAGGYQPAGALWLDGSADYLSWTPSSGSSNTSITYSFWAKRAGGFASYGAVLAGSSGGGKSDYIRFSTDDDGVSGSDDALNTIGDDGNDWNVKTTPIYRDPTAWSNYVVSFNNTSDIRIWVNGTEVTAFNPNTESGTMGGWLRATEQFVGKNAANQYFNGYLADVICLDGTNVTNADNFGELSDGIWVPKDPSELTFNGNSFWLDFANGSDIGNDVSGRNNDFTPSSGVGANNIAVDGPANSTDKEITLHACLDPNHNGAYPCVISNNNLTYDWDSSYYVNSAACNIGVSSGKYYWEVRLNNNPPTAHNISTNIGIGLSTDSTVRNSSNSNYAGGTADSYAYIVGGTGIGGSQGNKRHNGTNESYNDGTCTAGDIIGVAFDADNRAIWFSKNDSWIDGDGSDASGTVKTEIQNGTTDSAAYDSSDIPAGTYHPIFTIGANDHDCTVRFSSSDWSYSPPSGFGEITNTVTGTGNTATWNPLDAGSGVTLADGNRKLSFSSSSNAVVRSTHGVSSGKWYWEIRITGSAGSSNAYVGILKSERDLLLLSNQIGDGSSDAGGWAYKGLDGNKANNGSASSYGNSYSDGDVIGVALDMDNGKIWFAKNGTWQASGDPDGGSNEAFSSITGLVSPAYAVNSTSWTCIANFGQEPFVYPIGAANNTDGFKPLATQNLTEPTVTDPSAYFGTILYSGNSTADTDRTGLTDASGAAWTPDFAWLKGRSGGTATHKLYDSVRGAGNEINPDSTNAQSTYTAGMSDFIPGGIRVGSGTTGYNESGRTFVVWCLKANGAGSSDDTGGITVTRSTASHQGFSICKGTSTSGTQNFAHGLGAKPEFVILRDLDDSSQNWQVQHKDVNTNMKDITTLGLNRTNAPGSSSNWWGAEPTTTLQYFTTNQVTGSNDFVCYLFRRIPGMIGIGLYTSNDSTDGPHVIVDDGASGFRPAFVMLKAIQGSQNWRIHDSARNGYNGSVEGLFPNTDGVEDTEDVMDMVANGFKIRSANDNVNGGTAGTDKYIYIAFAEEPFGLNNRAR